MVKQFLKQTPFCLWYKRNKRFDKSVLENFIKEKYGEDCLNKQFINDMKNEFIFHGVKYSEYFKKRFEEKTYKQRRYFVPRCEELALYYQVNAREKYVSLLENKMNCYNFFRKYYNREVVEYKTVNDREKVLDFIDNHKTFIVKPLGLSGGRGIKVYDLSEERIDVDSLISLYVKGFVLEELIKQIEGMAVLHKGSVNCVRINTINFGNKVEVKWPCLKSGRGKSVVDNGCAGGIIAAIDVETGKTFAAADERRNKYKVHPDSNISLIDFEIPKWDNLCCMVKEMASLCPDCHIMGWDMALTSDGWVVVECNYGPNLIYQYVAESNFREEFSAIRKRLGARKFDGYDKKWQFKP